MLRRVVSDKGDTLALALDRENQEHVSSHVASALRGMLVSSRPGRSSSRTCIILQLWTLAK